MRDDLILDYYAPFNGPAQLMPMPMPTGTDFLMSAEQAQRFVNLLQLDTAYISDTAIGVRRREDAPELVTATAPGLWHPADIIAACRRVKLQPTFTLPTRVRPTNTQGLDELLIARVLASTGVRPYLVKPSPKITGSHAGDKTTPFSLLFEIKSGDKLLGFARNSALRAALFTLERVGLLFIQHQAQGGLPVSRAYWLPMAFLPPTLASQPLAIEDDVALYDVDLFSLATD
jgi:hypothetical protein